MPPLRQVPVEITSLTNEDLANLLRQYNVDVGPIMPTTRRVYERKLFELQTGEKAAPTCRYEPVDDDDDDDDEEEDEADEESADEEVVLQSQPRYRMTRSTRTEVRSPPRTPVTHKVADTTTPAPRSQAAQRQSSPPASKGGLPFWVKLLAVLIVASIVFLVIKNLESDPASDIPDETQFNV